MARGKGNGSPKRDNDRATTGKGAIECTSACNKKVTEMNKLQIEYVKTADLHPYERNPRKNDGPPVEKMIASIKEFGFAVPVLVRRIDNEICDGHLRLKAAVKMALKEIPVIYCDGWTDAQIRAFRLAANRSVTWASFDMDLLALEIADLKLLDFDLALTGFDTKEIDKLLLTPNAAEDDVPEIPVTPASRLGDLWIMGKHRLLCGDSTKAEDVIRLMDGKRAALINTDAPYGISYDSAKIHEHGVSYAKIGNDNKEYEELQAFLEAVFKCAVEHAIVKNAAWYLWHAMLTQGFFAAAAAAAHVILHRQIVWVKPALVFGRGHYHWMHELCFYGWIKGNQPPNLTGFKDTTVWEIPGVPQSERKDFNHPTPKPVELFRRPILKHLNIGEIAYEPFSGSGPQFIAAEVTDRICYGLELSPAFVDCIVVRWQNLTKKAAILEGDGRTFEEIKAERLLDATPPEPRQPNPAKTKKKAKAK